MVDKGLKGFPRKSRTKIVFLFLGSFYEFCHETGTTISKTVTQPSAHDAPTKSRHGGGPLKQLHIVFLII